MGILPQDLPMGTGPYLLCFLGDYQNEDNFNWVRKEKFIEHIGPDVYILAVIIFPEHKRSLIRLLRFGFFCGLCSRVPSKQSLAFELIEIYGMDLVCHHLHASILRRLCPLRL